MGNRVKLQAYRTAGRPVEVAIDPDATVGALLGSNLLLAAAVTLPTGQILPAGYVVQPSDLLNAFVPTGSSGGSVADWSQLTSIPANVVSVASLATAGLVTRLASGAWVTRSLSAGAGVAITDPSGAVGSPSIAHADTSSVADLNSNNANGVVIQDIAVTFDTFGHVQTATAGTVDLDLRYQPLDQTLTALAAANWAANALPIGTGADTLSQTLFSANTFPARASTGNLVPKTITDFILTLLDDATAADARTTLGAEGAITAGTTAQFWRGDKTFTNELLGLFSSRGAAAGYAWENRTTTTKAWTWYADNLSGVDTARLFRSGGVINDVFYVNEQGSIGVGSTSFGSGQKVVAIANATTVPSTNPTGGGVMYVEGGALKWRGPSGAITTMGVA